MVLRQHVRPPPKALLLVALAGCYFSSGGWSQLGYGFFLCTDCSRSYWIPGSPLEHRIDLGVAMSWGVFTWSSSTSRVHVTECRYPTSRAQSHRPAPKNSVYHPLSPNFLCENCGGVRLVEIENQPTFPCSSLRVRESWLGVFRVDRKKPRGDYIRENESEGMLWPAGQQRR